MSSTSTTRRSFLARGAVLASVPAIATLAGGVLAEPASADTLPDYAPVPPSALGPALNAQGYFVGRVEKNLYWVTDGTYQAAFLTTKDGVVLFDAPPTIGDNLQRAIDEIASANGVSNQVTHIVYSHHHADHLGASSLFGRNVTRVGQIETKRLLARDNDPARPLPDVTFETHHTLRVGGERIDLAWHGTNHTPDNIYIHFPDHVAAEQRRGAEVIGMVVRVDDVGHLVGHAVGGRDLVDGALQVVPDGRRSVEQDHALAGGQERRLVGAVGDPVEILLHSSDVVALCVECRAER